MESIKSLGGNGSILFRLSLMVTLVVLAAPAAAADTVRIYRSTMPDGSVVLGDKPSAGARAVVSASYVLAAPRGAAEAEREYWRRQAEAFNLRQQQREAEAPRHRRWVRPSARPGAEVHGELGDKVGWRGSGL